MFDCLFFGTGTWGCTGLQALVDSEQAGEVAVIGADSNSLPAPFDGSVTELARRLGVSIVDGDALSDGGVGWLSQRTALVWSVNWRWRIPPATLDAAKLGAINVHGSLLPLYRGPAPLVSCLQDGRRELGISVHHMEEAYDVGDLVLQRPFSVGEEADVWDATQQALMEVARAVGDVMHLLLEGPLPRIPQDHSMATWARPLNVENRQIDFRDEARAVVAKVRSLCYPYPGAWFGYRGKHLVVQKAAVAGATNQRVAAGTVVSDGATGLRVACGDGDAVDLRVVEHEGVPVHVQAAPGACLQSAKP